jgi:hypothetical protein
MALAVGVEGWMRTVVDAGAADFARETAAASLVDALVSMGPDAKDRGAYKLRVSGPFELPNPSPGG